MNARHASGLPPMLTSVCVFCGSNAGRLPKYVDAAREMARVLTSHGVDLVYGGGHVGLMGALADEMLARGGRVVGVIPKHLMRPEVAHKRLTELIVVDSMHTRKQIMAARSDAFIVLPGGFGTLEETFEMLTWLQLRLQAKPVGVVNVDGYFDALLEFLDHAAEEELLRQTHRDLVLVEASPRLLFERITVETERLRQHRPTADHTELG